MPPCARPAEPRQAAAAHRLAWLPVLGAVLLAGCLGQTPERARIDAVLVRDSGAGRVLEIEQRLGWPDAVLDALDHGIPVRLAYPARCGGVPLGTWIEIAYAPLQRSYVLRVPGLPERRYSRRGALLAALDRVRLPLPENLPDRCEGSLQVALDLTFLPTPLRFPALFRWDEWRMVSPPVPWQNRLD